MEATALTFSRTINAPPAAVFALFQSAAALQAWGCAAAQVDLRLGGRVYLWWNRGYYTAGVFTEVEPAQHLAFTWQGAGDPGTTVVQIDFVPAGTGTDVRVTHNGVGTDASWKIAAEGIRAGWEDLLKNLQSVVETGIDLREARRPLFGLGGYDLTPARVVDLGVPVTAGLWIGDVRAGSGAEAAGLQRDDVLVRFDDQPITGWDSLIPILSAHRAGDRLEAVFYRGATQQRVMVELSRRPLPTLPESAAALAETARALYAALDAEVAALFAGVSEAEAAYRPAPDAWNARQVLAHLIAVERDIHLWITRMIEGGDLEDRFHANDWTRLAALEAAYPSVADLLAELQRSEAATVAMIATLPPAVAEQKYLLHQLATWVPESPEHVREHLAELPALLAAARQSA
jgi:uncharacterized protein YndB with AHSA1/START domain